MATQQKVQHILKTWRPSPGKGLCHCSRDGLRTEAHVLEMIYRGWVPLSRCPTDSFTLGWGYGRLLWCLILDRSGRTTSIGFLSCLWIALTSLYLHYRHGRTGPWSMSLTIRCRRVIDPGQGILHELFALGGQDVLTVGSPSDVFHQGVVLLIPSLKSDATVKTAHAVCIACEIKSNGDHERGRK